MKRIYLTQRVELMERIGERRDALSQEWPALAEACGFLPIPLPNRLSTVRRLLEELPPDGILLTGGNDLAAYGGDAPERDEVERYLIERSLAGRIPLLGVCRGAQMLMDRFGTPLRRVEGHIRAEHPLSNGDTVNSFHSWGTRECRPPLTALAWSGDGVLEMVRHQDCPWIWGVMYHPERYSPFRARDVELIKEALQL